MKRILLAIALSGSFIGCSKKDGIVLFGVMLGDDAENAPKGEMVAEGRYRYKHSPELKGEWRCFYEERNGVISSVDGFCPVDENTRFNFDACRNWIKKNVPISKIECDTYNRFSTYHEKVSASVAIYNGDLRIDITLHGRLWKKPDPDLSK